jgi:hypothetical protein
VYVRGAFDDDQVIGVAVVGPHDDPQCAAGDELELAEVEHDEACVGAFGALELKLNRVDCPVVQLAR